MIDDEPNALLLMNNLPPSWESFVTTVNNASTTAVKYSEVKSSKKNVRSRFDKRCFYDAEYRWPNDQSWKKFCSSIDQYEESKQVKGNYCKKLAHIKAEWRALKVKNEKM